MRRGLARAPEVPGSRSQHRPLSDEHFTVDGTLIVAWAGQKTTSEREAAVALLDARPPLRRTTLGGHKNDDTAAFVNAVAGPTGDTPCRPAHGAADECH